jgi:hypothetical protein
MLNFETLSFVNNYYLYLENDKNNLKINHNF